MKNTLASRTKAQSLWGAALVCAVLTAYPRVTYAQTTGNKAAAEALFEQGRLLMQSGDYAQACQKLEASQKLDEGIGTLLYLADCYEKTGRTASAWAMFKEAASIAGAQNQESRQKLALQRAKTLEPGLVKLVIDVAKANNDQLGFEVRNDGVVIPSPQFGVPVPVDPGEHRIEASAPGKRSYSEVVKVSKGDGHVTIPVLEALQQAANPPTSPVAAESPLAVGANANESHAPGTMGSTPRDASNGSSQRLVGYIAGGAGIVGIGIGSYFGLAAIHDHNGSKNACADSVCYPQRLGQYNDAVSEARTSTIAFVAGGVLLATGVVLVLTAPEKQSHTLQASVVTGPNHAQITLGGAW